MENKEAIGIIEDLTKALENNGIIAQAPEIKEALKKGIEALANQEPLSNNAINNNLGTNFIRGDYYENV